jgi:hypothetical protein
MICGKHKDGRIILMAREHNLKPMIFYPQSENWEPANISDEELNDFNEIKGYLVNLLLHDAISFAEKNPEFKINK